MFGKRTIYFILLFSILTTSLYASDMMLLTDVFWKTLIDNELKQENNYRLKEKVRRLLHLKKERFYLSGQNINYIVAGKSDNEYFYDQNTNLTI
ncbi:MAG: hypothetical protein PQJ46_02010 [Spirochaetales bacterium]|nr:hypothetical protein [Spirochaetales bacterium]